MQDRKHRVLPLSEFEQILISDSFHLITITVGGALVKIAKKSLILMKLRDLVKIVFTKMYLICDLLENSGF